MTNPRFLPSAGLLLAIAACAPDFALTLPSTLDSLMTMGGWVAEGGIEPGFDEERGEAGGETAASED